MNVPNPPVPAGAVLLVPPRPPNMGFACCGCCEGSAGIGNWYDERPLFAALAPTGLRPMFMGARELFTTLFKLTVDPVAGDWKVGLLLDIPSESE